MTADLDLIRRAANQMRELAESATEGTWETYSDPHNVVFDQYGTGVRSVTTGDVIVYDGQVYSPDARHIAHWDPATALAVADSLDHDATAWEEYAKRGRRLPFARRERVLAVARAFLKEDA